MLRKHKKREKVCGDHGVMGKSQGVREARYRKARKLLKNAIAKVKMKQLFASLCVYKYNPIQRSIVIRCAEQITKFGSIRFAPDTTNLGFRTAYAAGHDIGYVGAVGAELR